MMNKNRSINENIRRNKPKFKICRGGHKNKRRRWISHTRHLLNIVEEVRMDHFTASKVSKMELILRRSSHTNQCQNIESNYSQFTLSLRVFFLWAAVSLSEVILSVWALGVHMYEQDCNVMEDLCCPESTYMLCFSSIGSSIEPFCGFITWTCKYMPSIKCRWIFDIKDAIYLADTFKWIIHKTK